MKTRPLIQQTIRRVAPLLLSFCASFAMIAPARADAPFPAHRVAGNTYYVGSKELASYLVTTKDGHILINSSFEETVPMIRGAIESLGFKMSDVKYLLASHAHSDHVAGHAMMRELTGAKVLVMEGDDQVVASGGVGQYLYTDSRWPKCAVDRVLKDGEAVELGGAKLTARRTPGHTRGCTTWTWQETADGKSLEVVVIGSPNVNPGYRLIGNSDYPTIAADYEQTFKVLKSLPCDIFLGAHGNYYGMLAKHERLEKDNAAKQSSGNPFIDPQGYKDYVALKETTFRKKLAEQESGPKDDNGAAEQLRKAGAVVTIVKGVATAVDVKDLTKFTDADFETLGRLVHLKSLSAAGPGMNDRTLSYLTGLVELESLATNGAQFSDDGLWQLSLLTNLKQIAFFHTSLSRKDFTGRGLAQFTALKNLRRLTVAGCPFNDEGMAAVGKLTQLDNFRTWHTYQTEAGNVHLKPLVNLTYLYLGQRLPHSRTSNPLSLTDATLDIVVELQKIESLTLGEQRFSTDALLKLKALPKLKRLDLPQVDVPEAEIEKVRAALPNVKIEWKPTTPEERTKLDKFLKQ